MADVSSEPGLLETAAEEAAELDDVSDREPGPVPAWAQLRKAGEWLQEARLACLEAPAEAGKAAEWLLDNDYQVHRALRQIGEDLPGEFYRQLPAIGGRSKEQGLPRVFILAHRLLESSRMQVSLTAAVRLLRAYQRKSPLSIAELWAFPAMLRIACVEILVSSLGSLLRGRLAQPFPLSDWASNPHSIDDTDRVARAIANLGQIAAISWQDFFEQASLVEEILRGDPSGYYERSDFETRDSYRRAVEELARYSSQSESKVAALAVEAARGGRAGSPSAHIGFWLVGAGRTNFAQELGVRLPWPRRWREWLLYHPGLSYGAGLALFGSGALLLPIFYLIWVGAGPLGWAAGLLLSFIPASVLAVTVLHWLIIRVLPPRVLPKLDCSKGLPTGCPTIVVVPVVIGSAAEVPQLFEQIEGHWLSNPDPRLQVALLADLADAPAETAPGDREIVDALEECLRTLNDRHRNGGRSPFHVLLRARLYNPAESCWMAWERKRGKLEQFNRMVADGEEGAFSHYFGDRSALATVRFVVTVDADTLLPPGSVARLVGALAHPLNRPQLDPETGRVVAGYSIIQPRVEISPQSGVRTQFSRLFTGDTSIDIYSRAVSDVYQDLFGAGIFVGKGIYDLQAFHRSVDGRVPENSILSHDLFEGAHGRVGLATDILFYEGFPASYREYSRRLHRWIRGDWQLLPWLGRTIPTADGSPVRNDLAAIDRWKIVDNLRRSLIAPSLLLLAVSGWLILPGSPWFWTFLAAFAPAGQLFTDLVTGLARGRRRGAVHGLFGQLRDQAGRWLLAILFLLHEAMLSVHAIAVTLWRLSATRKHLLQWTTAAQVAARLGAERTRAEEWRAMWHGPALAFGLALGLLVVHPSALPAALPLLLLWMAAPEVSWRISRAGASEVEPLTLDDRLFLRSLARKTWFFFETFAGPEDNWLPPDNYQGEPHEEIAHRTSPTNIGMLLLSSATAWDLGYLGRSELAARAANLFETLERMERYRGHLYNWYDTRSLRPLEPRYVSSVDSGNLAASLVAHAAALRDASEGCGLEPQRLAGLLDLIGLIEQASAGLFDGAAAQEIQGLRDEIVRLKKDRAGWSSGLAELCGTAIPRAELAVAAAVEATAKPPLPALRELHGWLDRLRYQAQAMRDDLALSDEELRAELLRLSKRAVDLAYDMDFAPLYDPERRLLRIGYNFSSGRHDPHYYDLLASEARLASLFAIAKRDVPLEHWFHLGRPVTRPNGGLALLSWSGSMFEYLMPRLLLRPGPETLLGESERVAVEAQRRYGEQRDVPWGISESAYAVRDPEHRYRYQAFGTPGLGLKRGLSRDLVIAPYASALALAVAPGEAVRNLRRIVRLGGAGRYGLIEALDFTAGRQAPGGFEPVHAYMAHHQGMILCAIGNALFDDRWVRRFVSDPRVRLVSLLLSERIPTEVPEELDRLEELERPQGVAVAPTSFAPWEPPLAAAGPQLALLGNGRMSSWVSESGGGGLRWRRSALTRFVPDSTRDADGVWFYVADEESGALWSATCRPSSTPPEEYRVLFHPHLAEFHRRDQGIALQLEVAVAPADDLEIRRLSVRNETDRPRRLRLTSYGEVVLAPPLDDERHPAFSKLFVGSEMLPELGALMFTRRPRTVREAPPVMLHFVVGEQGPLKNLRFETDRRAFIGRGRDMDNPRGAQADLSNSSGWTLDPIFGLQLTLELAPFEHRELCFVTVASGTRTSAIDVAERYSTLASLEWAIRDASAETSRAITGAGLEERELPAVQGLASLLVYPQVALRPDASVLSTNRLGQAGLWSLGISGDLPILLLKPVGNEAVLLPQLVAAQHLWCRAGFEADLVVLQDSGSAYVEPLREAIVSILRNRGAEEMLGRNGGIHLVFADQIGADQVRLLESVAHVVLDERAGSLLEQLSPAFRPPAELPLFVASSPRAADTTSPLERPQGLLFDNGIGGFAPDGREYVIHLEPGATTPAPWSNILANESFGSLVTEAGGGFSWAVNSGENRLTSWTNDPVIDRPSETLYLREEESGAIWSVTPAPAGRASVCQVRHGIGYSVWTQRSNGLEQELLVTVPPSAAVKLVRLRLTNLLDRHRRITATYYAEWLLGALQGVSRQHVACTYDADAQAILAASRWSQDFAQRVAFLASDRKPHSFTTDRQEFLGRGGDGVRPAGLLRWGLSGRQVAGGDPCAAYQVHVELGPGGCEELIFVLGQGANEEEAKALAGRWCRSAAAAEAVAAAEEWWTPLLNAVEVSTPDPSFDLMVNRWLNYQSLSSRILARTGFYQSSGAVGFRDQLQDVLALLHSDPGRVRAHILTCARHQFEEGDVLHWWHPPLSRGVRTRFSDDLVWLPYAVGTYVRATGDISILEEELPFLQAPPLHADEDDRYSIFPTSAAAHPLRDHCERALERACSFGSHGLPLIGSGDWNDGMDRVGRRGKGESVWLAWFIVVTAELFADALKQAGRDTDALRWLETAEELRHRAEAVAWDGSWYRRAYDDDGHPLGAAANEECRIDSISQSWAALAGAEPSRVREALESAWRELVDPGTGIARLLWPPFHSSFQDPGYIKAYPPGVRENGGQYSHAAAWLGIAFARQGDADRALQLFHMINPISRSSDRDSAEWYRTEPFAAAGDIGGAEPRDGRGGWSWYTGAAGWTWRLGVEELLGLRLERGTLHLDPCIPSTWGGYRARLRRGGAAINLKVEDPQRLGRGSIELRVAGASHQGGISFPEPGATLDVVAVIGPLS